MEAHVRSQPHGAHLPNGKLSREAAAFYEEVWDSARAGCLSLLRQKGCERGEAEEVFAEAYSEVMKRVDPVGRAFSAPEMVNFLKIACDRQLIDLRRHQAVIREVQLSDADEVDDVRSDSPVELAERREAIEIGREALQSLSRRDRVIFRMRYQMDLSPEEIQGALPGLSPRTYRKIIQRANARALSAYQRIDRGERCAEMEQELLELFVAKEAEPTQVKIVESHLKHCRSCRRACARMRGYLHDLGSVLAVGAFAEGAARLSLATHGHPTHLAHGGVRAFGAAIRGGRERARELALRLPGGASSGGGNGTALSQAISGAKIATGLCTGVAAVAGCAAVGIVLVHHGSSQPPATPAPKVAPQLASPPAAAPGSPGQIPVPSSHHRHEPRRSEAHSRSTTNASKQQSTSEFGVENGGAGTPVAAPQPTEPAPVVESAAPAPSQPPSGTPTKPEFGM